MKSLFIAITLLSSTAYAQLLKSTNGTNPKIGLNAMFEYGYSDTDSDHNGFKLSEAELQFASDIDPYFRGEATIGIHQEHHDEESEDSEESEEHGYAVEPEEVFVESLAIKGLSIKAGKFFADIGGENKTHTHARKFVNKNLVENEIVGDENLSLTGLSLGYLLPTSFYSEVILEALSSGESEFFSGEDSKTLAYNMKLKTLFEITEASTISFDVSALNRSGDSTDKFYSNDIAFKYNSINSANPTKFSITTSYLRKESAKLKDGLSAAANFYLSKRTFIGYRYDNLGIDSTSSENGDSNTVIVGVAPSEFSLIRLQYEDRKYSDDKLLTLQLNISMGAHPAHNY